MSIIDIIPFGQIPMCNIYNVSEVYQMVCVLAQQRHCKILMCNHDRAKSKMHSNFAGGGYKKAAHVSNLYRPELLGVTRNCWGMALAIP